MNYILIGLEKEIFFTRLYKTLFEINDPKIQNEFIEVCDILLEKLKPKQNYIKNEVIDFMNIQSDLELLKNCAPQVQHHIVSHFFTPEILNRPSNLGVYHTLLDQMFCFMIKNPPSQEFWKLLRTALDNNELVYTENVTISSFDRFCHIYNKNSEKDNKVVFEIFKFLWEKIGKKPTLLLHRLVINNDTNLLKYMISIGHPINHQEAVNKFTPLHYACDGSKYLDSLDILLENGADTSLKNVNGETAWEMAKNMNSFELGRILQESKFKHETLPSLMN